MKQEGKAKTMILRVSTLKRLRKAAAILEITQQDISDKAINAYLDAIKKDTNKEV